MLIDKKKRLINDLMEEKWLRSKNVIDAFLAVSREDFVRPEDRKYAYANYPLPIPSRQTISQPLTVAVMTEALEPDVGQKILEVGTGSGYQAAILSEIVGLTGKIITTEIIPELYEFARRNLERYRNVEVLNIDGSLGYLPESPYDRIIVTASAPRIPGTLIEQLKDGGRMVIPVGDKMIVAKKKNGKTTKTFLGYYAFVPLTGKHGQKDL